MLNFILGYTIGAFVMFSITYVGFSLNKENL